MPLSGLMHSALLDAYLFPVIYLSLEESGVLTTCDVSTLEVNEEYDGGFQGGLFSAFKSSHEEAQIVVKSEVLREGIQELV